MRKPTFWFPTRSDINQAVQLQKMARGLKFWIKKLEVLLYLCSENKGADQLRGYREADLRLCFRICKEPVFSRCGSYHLSHQFHVHYDHDRLELKVLNVELWYIVYVIV